MPISDRVLECIKKYNENDLDNALIQVCIALDGTAKREYPKVKKVGDRFKSFVKANQDIITFFMFNTNICIDCQFGEYTIERFIYKVLRCGLLHEGEVPEMFRFTEPGQPIIIGSKQWCLPKTFIFSTLLVVIGAASNSNQSAPDDIGVIIMGQRFKVNDLWGRADLVRRLIEPPIA
jgi:hypothetical protein